MPQDDLEPITEEPAELIRPTLDPATERRVEELAALAGLDALAVKGIVSVLLTEAVVVIPVANLSPDAEARRNLARFSSLPPPPEVPGVTISREDAPPAVVAQTSVDDGDATTLGAWADGGVPLLPAPTEDPDATPPA